MQLLKRCVLRACLNMGVDFLECMSVWRLFQTVGIMKEKGLCLKVFQQKRVLEAVWLSLLAGR